MYVEFSRELLQRFRTQEIIHWKDILQNFENELKTGTKTDPPTNVFTNTEDGKKSWEDFKARVVEHVSFFFFPSFELSKFFE